MKLIEKMAKEYEEHPEARSTSPAEDFMAGFRAAREMAAKHVAHVKRCYEFQQCLSCGMAREIENIGEEELMELKPQNVGTEYAPGYEYWYTDPDGIVRTGKAPL